MKKNNIDPIITREQTKHYKTRENRISGLSQEDIAVLNKHKISIPIILPYDFEVIELIKEKGYKLKEKGYKLKHIFPVIIFVTSIIAYPFLANFLPIIQIQASIPYLEIGIVLASITFTLIVALKIKQKFNKKQLLRKDKKQLLREDKKQLLRKDLTKFAKKFSKHNYIKNVISLKKNRKLLNQNDPELFEKRENDESNYALTTLSYTETLKEEFQKIIDMHVTDEDKKNDLFYQFETLINTNITKGYCTENQFYNFLNSIEKKGLDKIKTKIMKKDEIDKIDIRQNIREKFQKISEKTHHKLNIDDIKKFESFSIEFEEFINSIEIKDYYKKIELKQVTKVRLKIIDFKKKINNISSLPEELKTNFKSLLTETEHKIFHYKNAIFDLQNIKDELEEISKEIPLENVNFGGFYSSFHNLISNIEIKGYYKKEDLDELKSQLDNIKTTEVFEEDFEGLLEKIKIFEIIEKDENILYTYQSQESTLFKILPNQKGLIRDQRNYQIAPYKDYITRYYDFIQNTPIGIEEKKPKNPNLKSILKKDNNTNEKAQNKKTVRFGMFYSQADNKLKTAKNTNHKSQIKY